MIPRTAGSRLASASTYVRPPRTLKAPVGKWFSCLTTTSAPSRSSRSGQLSAGVGRNAPSTTSCARRISCKLNIAKPLAASLCPWEESDQHLALLVDDVVEFDAGVVLEVGHDHFVMRLPRGNHREAVLFLIDEAVEDDGPGRFDHLHDRRVELRWIRTAYPMGAIGLGQLDEVGQRIGVALRIAPPVEKLLPLAHHAHVLIVENEDFDWQAVLHCGRHLLHVHEDRGFTGDVDNKRLRMRELSADRSRQPV